MVSRKSGGEAISFCKMGKSERYARGKGGHRGDGVEPGSWGRESWEVEGVTWS